VPPSAFAGFRFPPDVIVLAVRWYLRFALSYGDVEELLAERDVEVDHVSGYRRVQRFTPLLAEAARPCRHRIGTCWFADETYVKVAGRWRYVYRAVDQFGQVIDVFVSPRRDVTAARGSSSGPSHHDGDADRGRHRPGSDLPDRATEAGAGGVASHRAVRQQPRRGRPRPAEVAVAADA
jgi:transposase InsO family protein